MVLIDILLTCLCPVFVSTLDPYGRNHSSLSPLCFLCTVYYTGDAVVFFRLRLYVLCDHVRLEHCYFLFKKDHVYDEIST